MKVKVAAIQMSADIGGREANVERAERLLIQAARQGADLCVLPELAHDVGISIPAAGNMISWYAFGVVIGAPIIALFSTWFV